MLLTRQDPNRAGFDKDEWHSTALFVIATGWTLNPASRQIAQQLRAVLGCEFADRPKLLKMGITANDRHCERVYKEKRDRPSTTGFQSSTTVWALWLVSERWFGV